MGLASSVPLALAGLILVGAMVLTGVCGCGKSNPPLAAGAGDTPTALAPVAGSGEFATGITLIGPSGTKSLALAELQAMESVSGYGGFTCPPHPGITGPTQYKGVGLADVLDLVGGLSPDSVVSVAATDGYVMTFTTDQIRNGTFVTYDPTTGARAQVDELPRLVLAYESGGEPLGTGEGPCRLVTLTDGPTQLVEGFLWVKWVTRIQIRSVEDDWTLRLAGEKDVTLHRGFFSELMTDAEHRTEWEDIQGRMWAGVPLYVLVELVTGGDAGEAQGGEGRAAYSVQITTAEGSTMTLQSSEVAGNSGYLIASEMEGNPLGDSYFPVSLVGGSLGAAEFLAGISEIRVSAQ